MSAGSDVPQSRGGGGVVIAGSGACKGAQGPVEEGTRVGASVRALPLPLPAFRLEGAGMKPALSSSM